MFHFTLPTCYAENSLIHIALVPEKNSKPPYRKGKNTVKFDIQADVVFKVSPILIFNKL